MDSACKSCTYNVTSEFIKFNGLYCKFDRWCEKGKEEFPRGCDEYVREPGSDDEE